MSSPSPVETALPPQPASAPACPTPASGTGANVLRLACWFGLLLGLVEVVARWVQYGWLRKLPLNLMHRHAVWMTFASDLAVYLGLGLILALAARFWPRRVPAWAPSSVFTVVFLLGLGDVVVVPSWLAIAALALGAASAAARSSAGLQRLAERTLWPLATTAAVLALGTYGWGVVREARADAAVPPAGSDVPSVLLLTLDTVRAQNLSLQGYPRPTTPRLEEMARRGVCFDRAISTVSWTLPSHASLFTGRYPPELFHDLPHIFNQAAEAPLDATYPTLAEYLGSRGYRTAGCVANTVFCDRVYGLNRGFVHYVDYELSPQQTLKSAFLSRTLADWAAKASSRRMILARKDAATVNGEFLHWLDGIGSRPFFAFLNYMEAHDPYDPPPGFSTKFRAAAAPTDGISAPRKSNVDVSHLIDAYDCCLAALDHEIGRLFDELDRRGVLGHTLVVVTSDHGEHFGEHGRFEHGDTLYMPVIHVPLVVVYPGKVPAGKRVAAPASLRDVPATVCDLLGVTEQAPFPGVSLRRLWEGARAEPAYSHLDMSASKGKTVRLRSLVDERYHYIEGTGMEVQHLYDLSQDRTEEHDLAGNPEAASVAQRCHALLEQQEAALRRGTSAGVRP